MSIEITDELVQIVNERVMYYFREISKIPRGSGKEQHIANYLVEFAVNNNFVFRRSTELMDGKQTYNVVIEKPATNGYESLDTVILQTHIDMVCQKVEGSTHNFDVDPIEIIKKNGQLIANGTTLGADDGIGVACVLAILENDHKDITHPRIEALFTSDEEDGMTGARVVTDLLKSTKRLINIDTATEGTLCYGCAGGITAHFYLPITHESIPEGYTFLKIKLFGLLGGHSGVEIHKKHANAHKLMARTLRAIWDDYPALLVSFTGGNMKNVIASEATALIAVEKNKVNIVRELIEDQKKIFLHEYYNIEKDDLFNLTSEIITPDSCRAISSESSERFLSTLLRIPNDVQAMHDVEKGLVETSCNLGIVLQKSDSFYLCSLIRSFYRTKKLYVLEQMRQLAFIVGANFYSSDDSPAWEPNPQSELLKRFKSAYKHAFPDANAEEYPRIESIHAGLECRYFADKFPDMDMIACGPTITGAHTPNEALDIASTEKVVKLLLTVLNQMNVSSKEDVPLQ